MRDLTVLQESPDNTESSTDLLQSEITVYSKPDSLTIDLIADQKQFEQLEEEWDELLDKSDGTIYSSFNWVYGWWKHFGKNKNRSLSIMLIRRNGNLICIAPLYISETKLLKFTLEKRLRLMGDGASVYGNWGFRDTYGRSDFLDIICNPDHEDEILKPLSEALKNLSLDQKIDYLNFEHINDRGFIKRKLHPYLESFKNTESTIRETDVCPSINLEGSFDDYLMVLSSSSRRKLRTALKAETKKDGFQVENVLDVSKLDKEIEILIDMHQSRWNELGYPGAFFDQRFEPFVKEFAKKALEKNQLWFKIAVDKSGHCATRLAFKYSDRYYDYLTSFDYDAPSSKYRPGIGLLTIMLKDAFTNNANSVELLRGDEAYKFDLTQTVYKNWNWKVSLGRKKNRLVSGLTSTISLLTFTVLKEVTLFQVQQNLHNSLKALMKYPKVRYQMLKYKYLDD